MDSVAEGKVWNRVRIKSLKLERRKRFISTELMRRCHVSAEVRFAFSEERKYLKTRIILKNRI